MTNELSTVPAIGLGYFVYAAVFCADSIDEALAFFPKVDVSETFTFDPPAAGEYLVRVRSAPSEGRNYTLSLNYLLSPCLGGVGVLGLVSLSSERGLG